MEYIKKTDGNVAHVDFGLHRARIAMNNDRPVVQLHHRAAVVELPRPEIDANEEPLPGELITIINFLRKHCPADYDEISRQVNLSCALDTPGHVILQEVLMTLESDRPLLFERVSIILT